MKPLPINEQIKVLKIVLHQDHVVGMCYILYNILSKYGMQSYEKVSDYIPSFTHQYYTTFYPTIRAVQKRIDAPFWDSLTIFGNLRRRWFVKYLIKELKKQL